MNSDEIKGKIEQAEGDAKQRIAGAGKDRRGQAEGMADELKGKLREGAGKIERELDERKARREVKDEEK